MKYAYTILSVIHATGVSGGILGVHGSERKAWKHWRNIVADRLKQYKVTTNYYTPQEFPHNGMAFAYVQSGQPESIRMERWKI